MQTNYDYELESLKQSVNNLYSKLENSNYEAETYNTADKYSNVNQLSRDMTASYNYNNKLYDIRSENISLKNIINEKNSEIKRMYNEFNLTQENILNKKNSEIKGLKNEINLLKNTLEKLTFNNDSLIKENSLLKNKVSDLSNTLTNSNKIIMENNLKIKELEDENKNRQLDNINLTNDLKYSKKETDNNDFIIKDLTSKLEKYAEQNNILKNDISKLNIEIELLNKELNTQNRSNLFDKYNSNADSNIKIEHNNMSDNINCLSSNTFNKLSSENINYNSSNSLRQTINGSKYLHQKIII